MNTKKANLRKFNSKFVLDIAKNILKYTAEFEYLDLDNILFIRSDFTAGNTPLFIYKLTRELIFITDIYYVVTIYPTFDLFPEHRMYREVYHILKHINKDYKHKPLIESHEFEMFEGEFRFNEQFRETLGMDNRKPNTIPLINKQIKTDHKIFDKLLKKEKLVK